MRLRSLDLNLMVPLDVLLAERSVTRAAERLGLGQPTMSAALARLRRHFVDDLLVRAGNRYELTPLATQLRPLVASALSGAERVFASVSEFDPSSAEREFEIVSSDYGVVTVGPALVRIVGELAPGVRLRLMSYDVSALDSPEDALREVDLMLLPHGIIGGFPHRDLLSDE